MFLFLPQSAAQNRANSKKNGRLGQSTWHPSNLQGWWPDYNKEEENNITHYKTFPIDKSLIIYQKNCHPGQTNIVKRYCSTEWVKLPSCTFCVVLIPIDALWFINWWIVHAAIGEQWLNIDTNDTAIYNTLRCTLAPLYWREADCCICAYQRCLRLSRWTLSLKWHPGSGKNWFGHWKKKKQPYMYKAWLQQYLLLLT